MENKEILFAELQKLSKRANQRILRLERLTSAKDTFAVKDLADRLSIEPLQAWTKGSRVSVSKDFSETQLIAINKAIKDFLDDKMSTVSKVKTEREKVIKSIGHNISYKTISSLYTAEELYKWAEDSFGPYSSDFWKDFSPLVFKMEKDDWVNMCINHIEEVKDTTIKNRLRRLYDLIKG